ncbi:MAG: hypothetical protein L6V93_12755 [Clostridiales bacterium]|nr:MAG: hypothetical protein L6V93_12755 [Clostridiales bacterium]
MPTSKITLHPDSLEFKKDYIKIGDKYARTVFLKGISLFPKRQYDFRINRLFQGV